MFMAVWVDGMVDVEVCAMSGPAEPRAAASGVV